MVNEVKVIADSLEGRSYDNLGFSIESIEKEVVSVGVETVKKERNYTLSVISYNKDGSGLTDEQKINFCMEIAERLKRGGFKSLRFEVLKFTKYPDGSIGLKIRPVYGEENENAEDCAE